MPKWIFTVCETCYNLIEKQENSGVTFEEEPKDCCFKYAEDTFYYTRPRLDGRITAKGRKSLYWSLGPEGKKMKTAKDVDKHLKKNNLVYTGTVGQHRKSRNPESK